MINVAIIGGNFAAAGSDCDETGLRPAHFSPCNYLPLEVSET